MDWNFEFLFCYLAAWHEVEQNKCKYDPQLSYYNKKIRKKKLHKMHPVLGKRNTPIEQHSNSLKVSS